MRPVRLMALSAAMLILALLPTSPASGSAVPGAMPAPVCPVGVNCPPPANGPLINIAKTASPTTLPAGGGPVTYTYTVTNGGSVPLMGVTVNDNKCSPVIFVGGDVNSNLALDLTETWTFTCTMTVTVTTTNVATAQGIDASGSGSSATATATVTVPCSPGTTGANCPPPTCPPGTTNPNCPPPTCPPGTTNPNCPPPGTICVIKFNDLNGDGKQQATEPVIPGITFTISPAVPPVSQTTTAANPRVCWTVPPGTYTVTETLPASMTGWVPTTPSGAPSASQTIAVAAGQTVVVLFGNHRFLIDHFECYTVAPTGINPPPTNIRLVDQFGSHAATVIRRTQLCNPVSKNREKVINADNHLLCYNIETASITPKNVVITDQFGRDVLQVVRATSLCLPTIKSLTLPLPNVTLKLDHYLCYAVKDLTPRDYKPVSLADQFGSMSGVKVIAVVALCNPVQKTYQGKTTKIANPVDHLVCYAITTQPFRPRTVFIKNQFESRRLNVVKPIQLCLPALKTVLN